MRNPKILISLTITIILVLGIIPNHMFFKNCGNYNSYASSVWTSTGSASNRNTLDSIHIDLYSMKFSRFWDGSGLLIIALLDTNTKLYKLNCTAGSATLTITDLNDNVLNSTVISSGYQLILNSSKKYSISNGAITVSLEETQKNNDPLISSTTPSQNGAFKTNKVLNSNTYIIREYG